MKNKIKSGYKEIIKELWDDHRTIFILTLDSAAVILAYQLTYELPEVF